MSMLTGALGMGRAQAESRFTETVTFYRVTGTELEPDPVTLEYAEIRQVLHADVPARVKLTTLTVSKRTIPGQQIAVQAPQVHVAVGATPDVRKDDYCECTTSTVDPSLVGRRVRVTGWPQSGQVTTHRYPVEEVS